VVEQFKAAGFVLVGGKSRRMGSDKALLEYEGRPLWLRAVRLLAPFAAPVTLFGPPERYRSLGVPVLSDLTPHGGPLAVQLDALGLSEKMFVNVNDQETWKRVADRNR
jgi:molybdenum cofactor guanylyltransferase